MALVNFVRQHGYGGAAAGICIVCIGILLLSGCGGEERQPALWQGEFSRSGDRVTVQNVLWEKMPSWSDWGRFSGCREGLISGNLVLTPGASPVEFQCRISRLELNRYTVSLQALVHRMPWVLRGEMDLVNRNAALDFQGRVSPSEYNLFHIFPLLQSGLADLRGSILISDQEKNGISFPQMTIVPVSGGVLSAGPLRLSGGRLIRREIFGGKTEFEMDDTAACMGGMRLNFTRMVLDRDRLTFHAGIRPAAPFQSTAFAEGEGVCFLQENCRWRISAGLRTAGFLQIRDFLIPLTDVRISGEGDRLGGCWYFQGESPAVTWHSSRGTAVGNQARFEGKNHFRFETGVKEEEVTLEFGSAELPFRNGRVSASAVRLQLKRSEAGMLNGELSSGKLTCQTAASRLEIQNLKLSLPLLQLRGSWITPEAGKLSSGALLWNSTGYQLSSGGFTGSLVLRERSWQIEAFPADLLLKTGRLQLSQEQGYLKWDGRFLDGSSSVSGQGVKGIIKTPWGEFHGENWRYAAKLDDGGVRVRQGEVSGENLQGPAGKAAAAALFASRGPSGKWQGKMQVQKLNLSLPGFRVEDGFMELPFGPAAENSGTLRIGSASTPFCSVREADGKFTPSGTGFELKGRARSGLTGGVSFFTGHLRPDFRGGALEYSCPASQNSKDLPVSETFSLPGDWYFSGKMEESGKLQWQGSLPRWQRSFTLNGLIRSDSTMLEDLTGELTLSSSGKASCEMQFRHGMTSFGELSDGQASLNFDGGVWQMSRASFDLAGGRWTRRADGGFSVKGIRPGLLLPVPELRHALKGTYSGTVRLGKDLSIQKASLVSDGPGRLQMREMERFRYLPKGKFDMNALDFAVEALRDFRYQKMNLQIIRRRRDILLRISGDGKPGVPVPFTYENNHFRRSVTGEPGFDGSVEIGCGYRFRLMQTGDRKQEK